MLNSVIKLIASALAATVVGKSEASTMLTTFAHDLAEVWHVDVNHLELSRPENEVLLKRFFPSWNFLRVTDGAMPPRVMYVATKDGRAEAVRLESGLSSQFISDHPQIKSSTDVEAITNALLAMAWPTAEWVRSLDGIPGLTREDVIRWSSRITEPRISREDNNFLVEGWLWDNGWVQQARLTVRPSGISVELGPKQSLGLALVLE